MEEVLLSFVQKWKRGSEESVRQTRTPGDVTMRMFKYDSFLHVCICSADVKNIMFNQRQSCRYQKELSLFLSVSNTFVLDKRLEQLQPRFPLDVTLLIQTGDK